MTDIARQQRIRETKEVLARLEQEKQARYWEMAARAMAAEDTRRRQIRERTDATCKAWAEWAQSLPQPLPQQKHIPLLDYMSTAE
jgi:hypothetical protein